MNSEARGEDPVPDYILVTISIFVPKESAPSPNLEGVRSVVRGPRKVYSLAKFRVIDPLPKQRSQEFNELLARELESLGERGITAGWLEQTGSALRVYVSMVPAEGSASVEIDPVTLTLMSTMNASLLLDVP